MQKFSFPKNEIKILLLENIHPIAVKMLTDEGFNVETDAGAWSEQELIAKASDCHVLGIRSKTKITPGFLKETKRL